jgi:CHAT domain-containing protein/tetratricopeptide (TPR) repeat protein
MDGAQLQPGVVVEKIAKRFAGEQAGLHEDDVILKWSYGEAQGPINSPFDLAQIEMEQGPRGIVTLTGRRGSHSLAWKVGPGEWSISSRPNFSASLLQKYHQRLAQVVSEKQEQPEGLPQEMISLADQQQFPWLVSWIFYHEAGQFAKVGKWPQADHSFEQAISFAKNEPSAIKAQILRGWSWAVSLQADWARVDDLCRRAIEESQNSSPEGLASTNYLIWYGRVLTYHGNFVEADKVYKQALAIQQKLAPDSTAVADTFCRLSVLAIDVGTVDQAEEFVRKALEIQQRLIPDTPAVALSLSQLAQSLNDRGDLAGAEESYRKAVEIARQTMPGSTDLASYLSGLGVAFTNRGKLAEADAIYRDAIAMYYKAEPNGEGIATTRSLLAQVEWARDDFAGAKADFLVAAALLKKSAPQSRYYTYCLLGLGILNTEAGDLEKAEAYLREMLAIQQKIGPEHLLTADAYSHLGDVLRERGNFAEAEVHYLRALDIQQKQAASGHRTARTLDALSYLAQRRGDMYAALDYGQKSLAILQKISPDSSLTAFALANKANIMRQQQQPEAAAKLYEESLAALDKQMDLLGGSDDLRSRFRAGHLTPYFQYVDLLVKQNKMDKALDVVERYRARSLMETMASAHVDIRKNADPTLLARERSLKESLNASSEKRIRLLHGLHTAAQISALDKEISELADKYQEVQSRLRDASPGYSSVAQMQPLTVRQIQETLLDPGTLMLEYALGEERSYVFALAQDSLAVFELPKRETVEKLARNVYQSLVPGSNQVKPGLDPRLNEARFIDSATELSTMVLGPVSELLESKRVVVIADGALQYIPFTALPDPARSPGGDSSQHSPLVVNHEVINLPSASVLAMLRREAKDRAAAPRAIAVLADPVFDRLDSRVAGKFHPVSAASGTQSEWKRGAGAEDPISESAKLLARSAADTGVERDGGGTLPRLLFSRKEAESILAVAPKGTSREFLDFSATRAVATSPELSRYRIVHFATHGLLDSEHPKLSGLVFSMVDQHGNPQNGFLQLDDIYNLNLPADLVVLSACETALGKNISGEGLIGLTRGFMYAGATRVVASLWKVSDAATASLMAEFYRAMEKDGMAPAAALRSAQIKMWRQKRWNSPYYWAAFQLQGEWK